MMRCAVAVKGLVIGIWIGCEGEEGKPRRRGTGQNGMVFLTAYGLWTLRKT